MRGSRREMRKYLDNQLESTRNGELGRVAEEMG